MRMPKRDVRGYIDKLIEYERGSDTKAPPGGFAGGYRQGRGGPRLHVGAEDVGGGRRHAQTAVVPSGPGWREEASRRLSQPRPQPEVAGPLTHKTFLHAVPEAWWEQWEQPGARSGFRGVWYGRSATAGARR